MDNWSGNDDINYHARQDPALLKCIGYVNHLRDIEMKFTERNDQKYWEKISLDHGLNHPRRVWGRRNYSCSEPGKTILNSLYKKGESYTNKEKEKNSQTSTERKSSNSYLSDNKTCGYKKENSTSKVGKETITQDLPESAPLAKNKTEFCEGGKTNEQIERKHETKREDTINDTMIKNLSEGIKKQKINCIETIYESKSNESKYNVTPKYPNSFEDIEFSINKCNDASNKIQTDKIYSCSPDIESYEVKRIINEGQWCFNTKNSKLSKIIPECHDAVPYSVSINSIVESHLYSKLLSPINNEQLTDDDKLFSISSHSDFQLPLEIPVLPIKKRFMNFARFQPNFKLQEDFFENSSSQVHTVASTNFQSLSLEDMRWKNTTSDEWLDVSCNTNLITHSDLHRHKSAATQMLETDLLDNIYQTISFTFKKNSTDNSSKDLNKENIRKKEFEKLLSFTVHYLKQECSSKAEQEIPNSDVDQCNDCIANKSYIDSKESFMKTFKNIPENADFQPIINSCLTQSNNGYIQKSSQHLSKHHQNNTTKSTDDHHVINSWCPVQGERIKCRTKRLIKKKFFHTDKLKYCPIHKYDKTHQKATSAQYLNEQLDINDVKISYDRGKFIIFLEPKKGKTRKSLWNTLSEKMERILKVASLNTLNIGTLLAKPFVK